MAKIGNPIRITKNGFLLVRSNKSKEWCREKTISHEWLVSLYLYTADREDVQENLGFSDHDYLTWLKRIVKRKVALRRMA